MMVNSGKRTVHQGLSCYNYYSNGNKTEWNPIQSVIIMSDKQNWLNVERKSNLFS